MSLPPEPQQTARRILLVDWPGAAQTRLAVGNLLFARGNPDYDAATIANRLLGSGGNSRLERMEGTGGALSARSFIYPNRRFTGYWEARITVRTEGTAAALGSTLAELRRLCDQPAPASELEEAKTAAIGRFALTLEQPPEVINYSYTRWRYGFSADYWERSPARISALTSAEIQTVAQKYYRPENAHIVAVGDASKIRSALEKFGNVES